MELYFGKLYSNAIQIPAAYTFHSFELSMAESPLMKMLFPNLIEKSGLLWLIEADTADPSPCQLPDLWSDSWFE